jgi:DNA-binding beta-propeller fold protein YncE
MAKGISSATAARIAVLVSTILVTACGGSSGGGGIPAAPDADDDQLNNNPGPAAPVSEPETDITNQPAALSNAAEADFTFSSDDPANTFEVKLDSGDFTAAGNPFTTTPLNDGQHTLQVRAVDGNGTVDSSPASYTWEVDTTPPETTITNNPTPTLINENTLTVGLAASENSSSFEASLDGGDFETVSAPYEITNLADGNHTLAVRAIDAAGNADPSPATLDWQVDTSLPQTTATIDVSTPTNSTSATFQFTADKPASTFEASLDNNDFAAATTPFTVNNLDDGEHNLRVRAVLQSGQADPTPFEIVWTVDTAAPDTTVTSQTLNLTNDTSASFEFTATENNSSFETSLDGADFETATTPFDVSGLGDGDHTLLVRATDEAGNVDSTPASFDWTVDTQPPNTQTTNVPNKQTTQTTATFEFSSSEANSTFEASVDGAGFNPATSPLQLSGLSEGSHTVEIRALDAVGNTDPTPVNYSWTIDNSAPVVDVFFPTPVSLTTGSQVTVTGSASDATDISLLTVNGVNATTSDDFATWQAVIPVGSGDNSVTVEAGDSLGNFDPDATQLTITGMPSLLDNPDRIALDETGAGTRALVVDNKSIYAIELATGMASLFADATTGNNPILSTPRGIAIDDSGNRALVTDSDLDALLAIDLSSGNQTVVSDNTVVSDVDFGFPRGVVLDASGDNALVIDSGSRALISVNLTSGVRTKIADSAGGVGPSFLIPIDLALDSANNRVLVTDTLNSDQIMAIDLATGVRSEFSGPAVGTGPALSGALRIAMDSGNNRALVADTVLKQVVAINLSNGNRTPLSDENDNGPLLSAPRGLLVDASNERAFVSDFTRHTVLEFSLNNGTRNRALSDGVGSGPVFGFVQDLQFDLQNQRIITIQNDSFSMLATDLGTGDRSLLDDTSSGSGPQIVSAERLAHNSTANETLLLGQHSGNTQAITSLISIDHAANARNVIVDDFSTLLAEYSAPFDSDLVANFDRDTAYVFVPYSYPDPTDPTNLLDLDSVVAVNLIDKSTREISGVNQGSGPEIPAEASLGAVLSSNKQTLYLADNFGENIFSIALNDGIRAIISGTGNGSGPDIVSPSDIALDSLNNQLIVLDSVSRTVFAVNLTPAQLGQRSILASNGTGNGPGFGPLTGVSVNQNSSVIYIYDSSLNALLAVEPQSGDRVIVSR